MRNARTSSIPRIPNVPIGSGVPPAPLGNVPSSGVPPALGDVRTSGDPLAAGIESDTTVEEMLYQDEPDPQLAILSIEAAVQGYFMTEDINQFTDCFWTV